MGRLALSVAKPNRYRHASLGFVAARLNGAPPEPTYGLSACNTLLGDSQPGVAFA